MEHHNPAEPTTTTCPFLPGQAVNILEVPVQVQSVDSHGRRGSASSIDQVHYTLNPEDKYLNPRPPTQSEWSEKDIPSSQEHDPLSESIHRKTEVFGVGSAYSQNPVHAVLAPSSHDRELEPPAIRRPLTCPVLSWTHASSWTCFHDLRQLRSAGNTTKFKLHHERPVTRVRSREDVDTLPRLSFLGDIAFETSPATRHLEPSLGATNVSCQSSQSTEVALSPFSIADPGLKFTDTHLEVALSSPARQLPLAAFSKLSISIANLADEASATAALSCRETYHPASRRYNAMALRLLNNNVGNASTSNHETVDQHTESVHDGNTDSVTSSVRSSEIFSPSLTSSSAYSEHMSPYQLQQPHTPELEEIQEYFLAFDQDATPSRNSIPQQKLSHLSTSGFGGYTLPEADHASALTLRKIPSNPTESSSATTPAKHTHTLDRVTSWNDGSPALEELFNELSYLGNIIA